MYLVPSGNCEWSDAGVGCSELGGWWDWLDHIDEDIVRRGDDKVSLAKILVPQRQHRRDSRLTCQAGVHVIDVVDFHVHDYPSRERPIARRDRGVIEVLTEVGVAADLLDAMTVQLSGAMNEAALWIAKHPDPAEARQQAHRVPDLILDTVLA